MKRSSWHRIPKLWLPSYSKISFEAEHTAGSTRGQLARTVARIDAKETRFGYGAVLVDTIIERGHIKRGYPVKSSRNMPEHSC